MFEDHVVIQDVTDDPERNTVLIIVGNVDDYEDFKSTVNLHDFNAVMKHLTDIDFWDHFFDVKKKKQKQKKTKKNKKKTKKTGTRRKT